MHPSQNTQFIKVFEELDNEPQTMLQVSVKTGILRANICRHIRSLKNINHVAVTKVAKCPISGYKANFYTTDRDLFPIELKFKGF